MDKQIFVKDFIEILDVAGIHIEEMGWEYLLYVISNRYYSMAEEARKNGYLATYRDYLHSATKIVEEMDRRGLR